ncbi:MAG TPA: cysteine desulfurase family protein [Gemmatimonadaceae bacterium]|jgi:cysteine desulfurase|nr:cysteine desulfurase family protein [Gemmatimonadaceae bacterium]
MPEPIYLDHAATSPVRPEVLEAMLPFYGPRFGNPSSTHRWGRDARTALDEARERVARCLGAQPDEICFTSGGTEADNIALLGAWRARRATGRNAIVTTPIEHKAVLGAVHQATREGAEERVAAMHESGTVDVTSFNALVRDDTAIASAMWVNNEIGTVQPIVELAAHARSVGALFHTDAVQAFGKIAIDARTMPFDVLTISGHKIGAPKGIGAVYIRRGTVIEPLFHGGTQDRGRRPGTENVAAAVGLARAAELAIAEREQEVEHLTRLRDRLEAAILARVPDAMVHGRTAPGRAPHILNVSIPGTDSESMLMALDLRGVACSAGSACQSGSVSPSHVLSAIGVPTDLASAAVRMSLGALSTEAGVDRAAEVLGAVVAKARGLAAAGD